MVLPSTWQVKGRGAVEAIITIEDLRRSEWLLDVVASIEADKAFEAGETRSWKEV